MESNASKFWLVVCVLALAGGIGYFLLSRSPEAVEARQAVHQTAEQATGLGAVKVGQEMKESLRGLNQDRREQIHSMEK